MLVHVEKRIVFSLHATAASRLWEALLFRRDFQMVGSRHEGPRNLYTYIDTPQMRAWWDSDPSDWDYAYMVRHHCDAILTWWSQYKHFFPDANQTLVCPVFLDEFPKLHARLFQGSRRLWRFVWDVPGAVTLYFESLRRDITNFMDTYDLPPIQHGELERDPRHITHGKPAGDWREHFTPEAVRIVGERYRKEMTLLGYRI